MRQLIAVALFCAAIVCFKQYADAQVPMTGAGLGAPASASCSFPSLSNLVARYKANTGVTTSSGNVTQVLDQSGNGYTLTNNNTVPFTASSAYNGHPAFGFAAANDAALFTGTGNNVVLPSTTALSVFLVGQMTSSTVSFGRVISIGQGGNNDFGSAQNIAAITRNSTNAALETTYNSTNLISSAISLSTNMRFGTIIAGGTETFYLNGSSNGTGSLTIGLTTPQNIVIGNIWDGFPTVNGAAFDGPILEVVIAASDITSNVSALDTYFTCSYGS